MQVNVVLRYANHKHGIAWLLTHSLNEVYLLGSSLPAGLRGLHFLVLLLGWCQRHLGTAPGVIRVAEINQFAIGVTVAILAQGTSWAVAVTQAFLCHGSILRLHHVAMGRLDEGRQNSIKDSRGLSWITNAMVYIDSALRSKS